MPSQTVLLDAHAMKRRMLQNALPLLGMALILAGIAVSVAPVHARVQGGVGIVLGLLLIAWAPRVLVSWSVAYKGHTIRFENSVIFGERLFIDDARITKGMFGIRKTLQGVIRTGEGQGDRITAACEAGLTIFRIKIVAESGEPGVRF